MLEEDDLGEQFCEHFEHFEHFEGFEKQLKEAIEIFIRSVMSTWK